MSIDYKISVITWDGNFREKTHTIDSFCNPNQKIQCEFIWVDYYSSNEIIKKSLSKYKNARLICLNNNSNTMWHLGKCVNIGAEEAKSDILVIADGDIVTEEELLENIIEQHKKNPELLLYHRRFLIRKSLITIQ